MARLVPALLAFLALAAAPARGGPPEPTRALPLPGVVDGRTGRELAAAGARVVDVRTPQEFAAGHVPGAINIPYDEIGRRVAEIGPADTKVLLYCRSGRRSAIAAEALRGAGFRHVWDMQRYDAWPP